MTGTDPEQASDGATTGPFAALYDRAVESLLNVSVTDEWVDTGVGRTHVLTAGDPDAPPAVVFQGSNITTPVTLAWVQSLAYRLLPSQTLLTRALAPMFTQSVRAVEPVVVDCLTLPGERHFLSPAGQARAADRIRAFLDEHAEGSG